jgi:hypothetical protein
MLLRRTESPTHRRLASHVQQLEDQRVKDAKEFTTICPHWLKVGNGATT